MHAKLRTILILTLGCAGTAVAGEAPGPSFVDQSMDANHPLVQRINELKADEEIGLRYFQSGNYGKAYTALAATAAEGFKQSQHAMAMMYLEGKGVAQHQLKGIALLGLVAESGHRSAKREYNKALKKFPNRERAIVEKQAAWYIARYGMEAQGVTCVRNKKAFSHFADIECTKMPGDYRVYDWTP